METIWHWPPQDLEVTRFLWCLTTDKRSPLHCSDVCIIIYLISLKNRKVFIMLLLEVLTRRQNTERVIGNQSWPVKSCSRVFQDIRPPAFAVNYYLNWISLQWTDPPRVLNFRNFYEVYNYRALRVFSSKSRKMRLLPRRGGFWQRRSLFFL